MKIVNGDFVVPKTEDLSSEYFETFLKSKNVDFLRWAVVSQKENDFVLNVSYKVD